MFRIVFKNILKPLFLEKKWSATELVTENDLFFLKYIIVY